MGCSCSNPISGERGAGIKGPAVWTSQDSPPRRTRNKRWMKKLPSDRTLSELSIPGTHASISYTFPFGDNDIKVQSWKEFLQLEMGLRFFNIPLKLIKDKLHCYHYDANLGMDFDDVLKDMTKYLTKYSTEFVVINIVKSGDVTESTESFDTAVNRSLDQYNSMVFQSDTNPTVGVLRGKMAILPTDYDSSRNFLKWVEFHTEIDFEPPSIDDKNIKVQQQLSDTRSGSTAQLYLTNTAAVLDNRRVANITHDINPPTWESIKSNPGRVGFVVMDFPGPALIRDIIKQNSIQDGETFESDSDSDD